MRLTLDLDWVSTGFILETEQEVDEKLDQVLHDARVSREPLQVRGSAGEDKISDALRGAERIRGGASSRDLSPSKVRMRVFTLEARLLPANYFKEFIGDTVN